MGSDSRAIRPALYGLIFLALLWCTQGWASEADVLLQKLNQSPHTEQLAYSNTDVIAHEIGLGALEKVSGNWRFKNSERQDGNLQRYTWQIIHGFNAQEVLLDISSEIENLNGSKLLFECLGRSCGQSAEWANRVFHQRLLYGREDQQHYRVYEITSPALQRVILYSSSRTSDKQYLHAELLHIAAPPTGA